MRLPFGWGQTNPASPPALPPVDEVLAQALIGRYSIERELARGGMATVYLARDLDLQRPVAIKVMHPDLSSVLGAERFLREVKTVRSLSHPLIVPLSESGEANGVFYFIMPFVDGESLYTRLQREGRIPTEEALRITQDVAAALGHAHACGMLHRDVKPENILLSGGRALVADFGLTRAIGAADSKKLTATGIILGTTYYLSPEQLREDQDLDQRLDIYSLGCILFEMLTGSPPYTGSSLKDIVTRILKAPVPSCRKLNPEVPVEVDRVLSRALAKSKADRYATMEEFAAALAGR